MVYLRLCELPFSWGHNAVACHLDTVLLHIIGGVSAALIERWTLVTIDAMLWW